MAARAYYDAVNKRTPDGLYRALLGAALIEPDRFHRCASFCARSLRDAYKYGQYDGTAILEDRIDKVQLVHFFDSPGVRPRHSNNLYTYDNRHMNTFDADHVQHRRTGCSIRKLNQECSTDAFWALLE
jgi:hypothetical protein